MSSLHCDYIEKRLPIIHDISFEYQDDIYHLITDTTVRFRHNFEYFQTLISTVQFRFFLSLLQRIPPDSITNTTTVRFRYCYFSTPFFCFALPPLSSRKLLTVTHRRSCLKVRENKTTHIRHSNIHTRITSSYTRQCLQNGYKLFITLVLNNLISQDTCTEKK
jgi:hypothetical protein